MSVLLEQGHSQSAVARLLGVSEGTVRYHRKRMTSGAVAGRSKQVSKASAFAGAIAGWRSQQPKGRINLALLHEWLRREHGYTGSLKSVQRYWKRTLSGAEDPVPASGRDAGGRAGAGGLGGVSGRDARAGRSRSVRPDRDAVVEPQARGGLGALQRHAVVAILPDRVPPATWRCARGSAHRQREDGDRDRRRELGQDQRDLSPFRDASAVPRGCVPAPASARQGQGGTARQGSTRAR